MSKDLTQIFSKDLASLKCIHCISECYDGIFCIIFPSEVSLKIHILFAGPYENWWVCPAISFHSCRDQN